MGRPRLNRDAFSGRFSPRCDRRGVRSSDPSRLGRHGDGDDRAAPGAPGRNAKTNRGRVLLPDPVGPILRTYPVYAPDREPAGYFEKLAYEVPSVLGVWYRGPFDHNGSVATLEDWFDPRRLGDDYVPTGWKGPPGTTTRAVKGHEFGLDLTDEERADLIAFLRAL